MSLLYRQAASTLRALEQRKKTVKSLVHQGNDGEKKSQTLAIRCLQYKSVLDEILQECGIDAEELDIDPYMLYIQVYEFLFGMGKISGGGEVKRKLSPFFDKLQQSKNAKMVGKTDQRDLLSKELQLAQDLPMYVRVNTCLITVAEALKYLREKLQGLSIEQDEHVQSLLVIRPGPEGLGSDEWVQSGKLVLQDKASCFPAQILSNHYYYDSSYVNGVTQYNGDIIDACAAPGNKTSQLATFLFHQNQQMVDSLSMKSKNNANKIKKKHAADRDNTHQAEIQGARVWAFDKSAERAEMLKQRMCSLHVDSLIIVTNQDFLSLDVQAPEYARVRNILLDPSCSGSGIVRNAIDRIVERQELHHQGDEDGISHLSASDKARALKLQAFQLLALQKAMSFPQVQRVVYSTCSVHVEENEAVVGRLLHESPIGIKDCWQVVPPKGFETWTRRGFTNPEVLENCHLTTEQARCLIRCKPEDGMNGFFVAMFERTKDWNEPIELPLNPKILNSKNEVQDNNSGSNKNSVNNKKRKLNDNRTESQLKRVKTDISQDTKKKMNPSSVNEPSVPKVKIVKEKVIGPNSFPSFFSKNMIGSRSMKRFGKK